MGFGREARRARDESLPSAQRVRALTSCGELAQPIGFHATWSYLQERTGMTRHDPRFVTPAIDLLEAERAKHLVLEMTYVHRRRIQKAAGLRFPSRCDASPRSPSRWHGDERAGARHALEHGRQASGDLAGHPMRLFAQEAAARAVAYDELDDAAALQSALDWSRRQVHVVGWESDAEQYRVARDVHRLLGQVYLLKVGVPAVAEPWHFVSPDA